MNKRIISITMTCTIRPSLLELTLNSFFKNLFYDTDNFEFLGIINIDSIGEHISKLDNVINILKNYFSSDKLLINISDKPNFNQAVYTIWNNINIIKKCDYIFHLEEDWILFKKINLNDMCNILDNNNSLASLRLSKYNIPNSHNITLFNAQYIFQKNKNYFLCEDNKNQFGLNPVLINKLFINEILPRWNFKLNPEKQFRLDNNIIKKIIIKWNYGIYGNPGHCFYIEDIGRNWMKKNNLKKQDGIFLHWIENK